MTEDIYIGLCPRRWDTVSRGDMSPVPEELSVWRRKRQLWDQGRSYRDGGCGNNTLEVTQPHLGVCQGRLPWKRVVKLKPGPWVGASRWRGEERGFEKLGGTETRKRAVLGGASSLLWLAPRQHSAKGGSWKHERRPGHKEPVNHMNMIWTWPLAQSNEHVLTETPVGAQHGSRQRENTR